MSKFNAYILAGGKSRRLNFRNKALLNICGKSAIEYIIDAVNPISKECIIVQ